MKVHATFVSLYTSFFFKKKKKEHEKMWKNEKSFYIFLDVFV